MNDAQQKLADKVWRLSCTPTQRFEGQTDHINETKSALWNSYTSINVLLITQA